MAGSIRKNGSRWKQWDLFSFLREIYKPYYEKEEEIRSGRILSGHEPIKFG